MSILGVIVRTRLCDRAGVAQALQQLPGLELAESLHASSDGRLVVVIEDTPGGSAAASMAAIALWPRVLNTSLVYEYSGPDAPAPTSAIEQRLDWRCSLADMAQAQPEPHPADTPSLPKAVPYTVPNTVPKPLPQSTRNPPCPTPAVTSSSTRP